MLSPTAATIRLVLHVLAATVWVGGQIVLGGLVGAVRNHPGSAESGILKVVARAYNRVAWPAFAVLLATGVWNLMVIKIGDATTEYQVTVFLHVTLAAVSGTFAAVHIIGRTRLALAIGGALGLLGALGALFVGVLLRTGS